jgi:nitrogen-specific signal transduction histidine kinase
MVIIWLRLKNNPLYKTVRKIRMANNTAIQSEFAPAECLDTAEINRQAMMVSEIPYLSQHFDAIPNIVLILNKQRQIVFANSAAIFTFKLSNRMELYGLRPGRALNCSHAQESQISCGTTSFCRECGATKSILSSLAGNRSVEECRISTKSGETAFDFRVTSSPYNLGNECFVIFALVDISNEKRREVLERMFFHDIKNTVSLITVYVELMNMDFPQENNELLEKTIHAVNLLASEIKAQQELLLAEDGELSLHTEEVNSLDILHEIVFMYKNNSCAQSKNIQIDDKAVNLMFTSDKTQLLRIIGNMLKNSLEESSKGDTVKAGCDLINDAQIRFWVWNSQYIPEKVQLQIFNRSFSTKGVGRGIGTYSMKLLGEQYLKGKVNFTSEKIDGTTFFLTLPLS